MVVNAEPHGFSRCWEYVMVDWSSLNSTFLWSSLKEREYFENLCWDWGCGRKCKESEDREKDWECCSLGMTQQMQSCSDIRWMCLSWAYIEWSCQQSINDKKRFSLLHTVLLATDGFWVKASHCLQLWTTGESTSLQWIVPNLWSHRRPWLNAVGHIKTQQKDTNARGELVGKRQRAFGKGRWEIRESGW